MKKKKSVTVKIAVYLILVSVFSNVLIFGMNYLVTQKNMQKQMQYMAENVLTSQIAAVEQYFEEIEQIANSVLYNKRVIRFLKEKQDQIDDADFVYGIGRVYYNTWQNFEMTFYKEGQYHNKYSVVKDDRAEEISDYRSSIWYQKIKAEGLDKVIISQQTEDDYENYVVYRIKDRYSVKTVGYLRIELKLSYLKEQILKNYRLLDGTTIYNQEKQMLFYDEKILEIPDWESDAGFQETKENLIAWQRSESIGWNIVMAISKEELLKDRRKQFLFLTFLVGIIIFLTIRVSKKFFSVITGNYKRLMEGMEKAKQGELTVQVENKEEDEISNLILEFNTMMNKIDELMRSVEGKQALRLGVSDYILKPVKKEELEKVLKMLSQQKEKEDLPTDLPENHMQKKESKSVVEDIMEYIQKHYYENINVSELAEMYYLNDTYLSTLFKEKTGWTLKSYLESVRIEKAKSMLKSRDYTIAYVASAVGYTDPNYFSKVFKRYTDLTPRQFREIF